MTSLPRQVAICFTGIIAAGLNGCVLDVDSVPEMPYHPRHTAPQQAPAEEPVQTTTWENSPEPSSFITPPAPAAAVNQPAPSPAAPATTPTKEPAPTTRSDSIPEPTTVAQPAPVTAAEPQPTAPLPTVINLSTPPATSDAPTSTPAPAPSTDLKQVTNTGPIPTAARVEGDPTRVWNPLDPSKKIRIINPKTNQPYPSGKKLKVRGTNFQFYVP